MPSNRKVEEKLLRREKRYDIERRMREKRSEEYEVLEEVFDKSTLMTIYQFMNSGVIKKVQGIVNSGKESRVYLGIAPEGRELALKIYLIVSAEFRKGMLMYIQGDPRFNNVKHDTKSLVYSWALKEFKNLRKAYDSGVHVPKPIIVKNNVLIMEFIGKDGVPAPLLRDITLEDPETVYQKLLGCIKTLYKKARLVHGDLSEYNVMMWKGEPVVFDVSQAVPLEHPAADKLLHRDIENLNNYFYRLGIKVKPLEAAYEWVKTNE